MTSTSIASVKNADTTSPVTGIAVTNLIVAEAARRVHLADGILSAQWDRERGIGLLMADAGQRQHLANALDFDKTVETFYVRSIGTGLSRSGTMFGFTVTIWNLES
jgi:hypothetical protein